MSDFNADGTVHDAVIAGLCSGMVPGDHTDVQRTLVAMAREIRQRRAADPGAEEREALAWMRDRWAEDEQASGAAEWRQMHPRALAALDKLTSKPGGE